MLFILFRIHEKPIFQIANYYAEILKTMYFAAFYAPIIPVATILSLIQLIIYYIVLKYNLLRRSCVLNS